jgi:hypothetical protein
MTNKKIAQSKYNTYLYTPLSNYFTRSNKISKKISSKKILDQKTQKKNIA